MAVVPVKEVGSMSYQVPVLTATNYPVWAVKVKSIMDAYGLWGTVDPQVLGEEFDAKKSKQALAFLFQAIPEDMVLQMASYNDPKQVWDGLKTRYLGVDRVRTARLATLKRELESLRMKEGETVDEFATKLSGLASKARGLGYELEEVDMVKRLLDSMPKSFLQIVASIEQCFELDSMLFDEAVGRLKAYEERIKGAEKMEDTQGGLLLASDGKSHGCKHCGGGSSNRDDFGRGRGRGRGSVRGRDGNERVRDKSHVKCYKCGDYGHYNNECPKNEEANLIEEEVALL
ncbi:zinc finger, CCHC-type [Artemisia annua]|uniref:Zinc finger, CCHC-type n=1 Tax=Artemisia annua TaxID=35608 RepID=A0A2U1N3Y3_ARTAN|nr:zinc finger, CCHC-type [Artemisia annua]